MSKEWKEITSKEIKENMRTMSYQIGEINKSGVGSKEYIQR